MRITYFLKKGFQFYPPCLAEVLYLNDLGVELTVYHGSNSEHINHLFEQRGISHITLKSDNFKKGKFATIAKFLEYTKEMKQILKNIPREEILWFGNCESAMTLSTLLKGRRFIFTVLELYDHDKLTEYMLKKVIGKAALVTCCEKHRAAIMKSRYNLKKTPYVMPNKPYCFGEKEISYENAGGENRVLSEVEKIKEKFIVLYQGMIGADRPLANIAKALKLLDNKDIVFLIMGKGDECLVEELKAYYENIVYLGFVPNPQHLEVTKYANIGIANYDFSCLNNVFCAPNKIYEYACFSVPMITSENVGLTETVGKCGAAECVDFTDIVAIKDGIERIVNDFDIYKSNALKFYQSTDNKETMESILREIEAMEASAWQS